MQEEQAKHLCKVAHSGQKRRGGAPYHVHPFAVAEMVTTNDEKVVAYLHDVFEDCPNWYLKRVADDSRFFIHDMNTMTEYDITEEQYLALMLITKVDSETYAAYMTGCTENAIASNVKLADMYHNSSDNPSANSLKKYSKYIPIMEKAVLDHYENY